MTIRFYPSRLPGEPLAKREHAEITLHDWLRKNVPSYTLDRTHPIAVEVNGCPVPPAEWPLCYLRPDSDVRIYPVPYGTGAEIAAWAAIAVAVASAAYSIIMMSQLGKSGASTANGDQMDLSPAKERFEQDWSVDPVAQPHLADFRQLTTPLTVAYEGFEHVCNQFALVLIDQRYLDS